MYTHMHAHVHAHVHVANTCVAYQIHEHVHVSAYLSVRYSIIGLAKHLFSCNSYYNIHVALLSSQMSFEINLIREGNHFYFLSVTHATASLKPSTCTCMCAHEHICTKTNKFEVVYTHTCIRTTHR